MNHDTDHFGDYQVLKQIGSGGFARVYQCKNIKNNEIYAVKALRTDIKDEDMRKRFCDEADILKQLNHNHIIAIRDFAIDRTTPFLVMDYMPKGSLRELHPKGSRLNPGLIVQYVEQIAEALQYAHDKEILHLDVKPENILLSGDGHLLLSDFSIALIIEKTRPLDAPQEQPIGTPPYMAPEQFKGNPLKASDQYALAVVVYEWICGETPHLLNNSVSPLHQKVPELHNEIGQVVLKALNKEPDKRFPDVRAFAQALKEAYKEAHDEEKVPTVITKRGSPKKQRLNIILVSSIIVAFIIIITGIFMYLRVIPPTHPILTTSVSVATETAESMFGSDAQHTRNNPTETLLSPHFVQNKLTIAWTAPTGGNPADSSPVIADGTVYVGSVDGKLYAFDAQCGTLKWTAPTGKGIYGSPAVANGLIYVGSDDNQLYAFDMNGNKKWSYPTKAGIYSSPVVHNGIVYFGSEDSSLYALNATTGEELWSYPTQDAILSSPAVSQGIVYVGSLDGYLYALDAKSGKLSWPSPYKIGSPIFSSPTVYSSIVYVGSEDNKLYAIDAKSGQQKWSYPTNSPIYSSPAANSNTIYIGSDDHTLYALDAFSGTKLWSYSTRDIIISSPTIASGIVYIGSGDNTLYALEISSGAKLWSYTVDESIYSSPTVADGKVYVRTEKGTLYAFHREDLATPTDCLAKMD